MIIWRNDNIDRIKTYSKEYKKSIRERDKEKQKERARKYYLKHKKERIRYSQTYNKSDKGKQNRSDWEIKNKQKINELKNYYNKKRVIEMKDSYIVGWLPNNPPQELIDFTREHIRLKRLIKEMSNQPS